MAGDAERKTESGGDADLDVRESTTRRSVPSGGVSGEGGAFPELVPGTVLDGCYEIDRLIGQGGMGAVYEARHLGLDKRFAVKVVGQARELDSEAVVRLEREARTASAIDSAHIVNVTHLGRTEDDRLFVVMELLEGEDLRQHQQGLRDEDGQRRPLGREDLREWVPQLLSALAAAHEAGIVHRDLKPENVYLSTRRGEVTVKLLDFGMSKLARGEALRLTRTGQILGTPLYMAPEQARGDHDKVDERSDVYSLGVILYEMLCGEVPFPAETLYECVYKHTTEAPPPLEERCPELPASIVDLVHRCLEKKQDDRFADASAVQVAWEAAWREPDLVPVRVSSSEQTASFDVDAAEPEHRMGPWWGAVGLGLLMVAGGGAAWWASQGAGEASTPTTSARSQPRVAPVADEGRTESAATERGSVRAPTAPPVEAPALPAVTIRVTSEPAHASIQVAGVARGRTPIDVALPEGQPEIAIALRHPGYQRLERTVTRDDGESIEVELEPVRGAGSRPPLHPGP